MIVPGRMSPTGSDLADHASATWLGLGAADAGALEHAGEAVAAAEGGAQVDDRPLGRFGERLDRVGRRHAAAGVGAVGERRDGERARFLALGVGQGRRRGAGDRRRSTGASDQAA